MSSLNPNTANRLLRSSLSRSYLWCGLFLIPLVLVCFGLSPTARAADGGLPGFNTAEGTGALFSLTTGTANTGLGENALKSNTSGSNNTATGSGALFSSSTSSNNTATGNQALVLNTSGSNNTATGNVALFSNTSGSFNTAIGGGALFSNIGGSFNTAAGQGALRNNNADQNTAFGQAALFANTTGDGNTAVGEAALQFNDTGSSSTAIGIGALLLSNSDNNIGLGTLAGVNVTSANHTINIGTVGENTSARTYIANIGTFTQAFSAGVNELVTVNLATGRLGHFNPISSRRYKEDIKSLDKTSEALFALKPVSFHFKKEYDETQALSYGLIAEEVEKVAPALVSRNNKGQVESVRYEMVNAMLLNEFLKEHQTVKALKSTVEKQEALIAQQQKGMEALTAQLKEQAAQIQKVSAQLEVNKPTPQVVNNNP